MESLVLFARAPVLGEVKTRLAERLGAEKAARLYAAFLLDTLDVCASWRAQTIAVDPNRRLVLYVTPGVDDPIFAECARRSGAQIVAQPEGPLGERLAAIFSQEFDRGARAVCAIGSDAPTLPLHLIEHAFRALRWERVVLGPSADGGYWTIGAQRPAPDLFTGIPWSTPDVMSTTLAHLHAQDVPAHILPFWYDVDDDTGLAQLTWHLQALRQTQAVCPATWALIEEWQLGGGT